MQLNNAIGWFELQDKAWHDELARIFGENDCSARYRTSGQGEPGTLLRALYEARMRAMAEYTVAWRAHLSRDVSEAAKGLDL